MELKVPKMTKEQFVEILKHYGSTAISAAKLDELLAAGAPAEEDGTINIVHFAAWILKELCHAE